MKIDIPAEHWDGVFGPSSFLGIETTRGPDGRVNAAAHATVTRVSHVPVDIAITVNDFSHTWRNIEATGEFVVNLVPFDEDVLRKVRIVGLPFEDGVNELERAGLTALESRSVSPPRVAECPAHFECRVEWTRHWGHRVMVVGRVVAASMDEEAYDPRGYIRWHTARPAHFCGVPFDGNFVPAFEHHFVPLDYDGPRDWRPDLTTTVARSGVDWGSASSDLDYPNVLAEQEQQRA